MNFLGEAEGGVQREGVKESLGEGLSAVDDADYTGTFKKGLTSMSLKVICGCVSVCSAYPSWMSEG